MTQSYASILRFYFLGGHFASAVCILQNFVCSLQVYMYFMCVYGMRLQLYEDWCIALSKSQNMYVSFSLHTYHCILIIYVCVPFPAYIRFKYILRQDLLWISLVVKLLLFCQHRVIIPLQIVACCTHIFMAFNSTGKLPNAKLCNYQLVV